MSALKVISCGQMCSLQDAGRIGHLRYGVGTNGPMDWRAYALAGAMVANGSSTTALEVSIGGAVLEALSDCVIAVAGTFLVKRNDAPLPPSGRYSLRTGDQFSISASAKGSWAYITVPSGFKAEPWLGSCSTDLIAGRGGHEGRMLKAGDVLLLNDSRLRAEGDHAVDIRDLLAPSHTLAVIEGPQANAFTQDSVAAFYGAAYTITPAINRMGYRLSGSPLTHKFSADIVSDGIAPGAIQVPGDGQPIALMAGRQPTGGYAKIGVLTELARAQLAQGKPGDTVRFVRAPAATVTAADVKLKIATCAKGLRPLLSAADTARLLSSNLIDGVTDGSDA